MLLKVHVHNFKALLKLGSKVSWTVYKYKKCLQIFIELREMQIIFLFSFCAGTLGMEIFPFSRVDLSRI